VTTGEFAGDRPKRQHGSHPSAYGGHMSAQVRDDRDASRYVIELDGHMVGAAYYKRFDDHIVFTHTEVDEGHQGEGLAGQLVQTALDDTRAAGLRVVALCPYVRAWIQRHPEYQDLQKTTQNAD
jgi:predicted GNAT family acetyltransferase